MLVAGGRFGWARVISLGTLSLGVVGSISTAACGSRTSMLDADAYGPVDGEGGSSPRAPVGQAGKTSTGAAGRPSSNGGATTTPTAGTGSGAASAVDPSAAVATCQKYCPNYGTQCKKRLKGQDCLPTCEGELSNFGPVCQNLGISALNCLTPFFNPKGGNCDAAVNRALTQCGELVTAFSDCKDNFAATTSKPPSPVASCPRSGPMDDGANCSAIFDCGNKPFITFCNQSPQTMLLECVCVTPSGPAPMGTLPFSSDPCLAATKLCQ